MESTPFKDKSIQPDKTMLTGTLGETLPLWEAILSYIIQSHGPIIEEWKFYSPKFGWTLKVLLKKRNLFFFTAYEGYFGISFVFGNKAVSEVEKSDLPVEIIDDLRNARKYAEGRGIQIIVTQQSQVEIVKKLIAIKIAN